MRHWYNYVQANVARILQTPLKNSQRTSPPRFFRYRISDHPFRAGKVSVNPGLIITLYF